MIAEPNCAKRRCLHFLGVQSDEGMGEEQEHPYCVAFPEGIPVEICYGPNLHLTPVEGDNGLQYEPDPEATLPVTEETED
jgi:hypothetical protein